MAAAGESAHLCAVLFQALYLELPLADAIQRARRWWSNPAVMHGAFGAAGIDGRSPATASAAALLVLPVTAAEERWRRRRGS